MSSIGDPGERCEQVLQVQDAAAGAVAFVVVHDTRLGPAHGGIRRWRYASPAAARADAEALARAMTWKCALADVPAGGGKAVLMDHDGLDREAGYHLVGRAVDSLGGRFFTGPDVGTTAADLRVVAQQTRHVVPVDGDGPGDLAAATARGVAAALAALAQRLERPLAGLRVVVQGVGAVGEQLCMRLSARGVRLVVGDVDAARAAAVAAAVGAEVVAPADLLTVPCDVFAPCGLGGVLTTATAGSLPAAGVCGAANNVLADAAAGDVLHRRGVQLVPDFVANAGALIAGCLWHRTGRRVDAERIDRIGVTAGDVLDRAAAERVPPAILALRLARERVERAAPRQ
jgi:leucine dehydrogenase